MSDRGESVSEAGCREESARRSTSSNRQEPSKHNYRHSGQFRMSEDTHSDDSFKLPTTQNRKSPYKQDRSSSKSFSRRSPSTPKSSQQYFKTSRRFPSRHSTRSPKSRGRRSSSRDSRRSPSRHIRKPGSTQNERQTRHRLFVGGLDPE